MKAYIAMLSAGIAALALSGAAWAGGDVVVSPAQIEAAKTPADHEAIAKAYDAEATRLETMAKDHEAMARAYRAAGAGTKGADPAAMSAHCNKLMQQYKAAAKENRDLAAAHRQEAKECCKTQ